MHTYAITGKAGSGKSAVVNIIQQNNADVIYIDADHINANASSASAVKSLIQATVSSNLKANISDNNAIRLALADSGDFRAALESILHPIIKNNIELEMSLQKSSAIRIIEVPLLFQAGWHHHFPDTICVISSRDILASRVNQRDGESRQEADKILSIQLEPDKYIKYCKHIVLNDSSPEILETNVKMLSNRLN